jgi:predicted Zn-dependent protease
VHYSYGVFLLPDEPDGGLEELRRELEVSPSHVRARLQIAFEYIRRNEHAVGLPFAEEALRFDPQSFAAHNALGRILLEIGDVGRAVQVLETGVKLAPDSPETRYALARAYARAGRKEDAAHERAEFARLNELRRGLEEETQSAGPQQADRMERPPI